MVLSTEPLNIIRFNPRPCVRGDSERRIEYDRDEVSIHAPV